MQKRIFKAVQEGDMARAKRLQKLVVNSYAARMLAIRQVTQLNQGKKTAGVDGKTALNFEERFQYLTLVFPHQHEPVTASGFHSIGVYSYSGPLNNPLVASTSTNNALPEVRYNLPPIPLFPGTGLFTGSMISRQTSEHMYSDIKTKPVHHLVEDLADPYVSAIYNSGNGRWQGLLGDEAVIALELINITPGLTVVDANDQELFDSVGETYIIGQGDDFEFTPIFKAPQSSTTTSNYSASFRFLDVNNANGRTPWLPSGTFTLNFQAEAIPEPSTVIGLGFLSLLALSTKVTKDRSEN